MAITQQNQIVLILIGDGVATSFTYSFSKFYETITNDAGQITAPNTLPTSVSVQSVNGAVPVGTTATLDGFGNLVLTFPSAFSGQGQCIVNLEFASGTLAGTTAAWTSATALNTTWTLPLSGAESVLLGIVVTGTVTAGNLNFEVSMDGATWFATQGTLPTYFQFLIGAWTPASGNAALTFDTAGYSYFRVRLNPVITGSGTVTFIIQAVQNPVITDLIAGMVGTYNSSAPALVSGGVAAVQLDAYGNTFVNVSRRSQVVPETGNIASATAATLCPAQGAGIFADLATLVLSLREGATANVFFGVNISDGTKTYRFNFMSQDVTTFQPGAPFSVCFDPPMPATTANIAWTIALTSATDTPSVDYIATFVKQQAE